MTQKRIKSKFYCIQPLYIEIEKFSELLTAKLELSKVHSRSVKDDRKFPTWFNQVNKICSLYRSIAVINIDDIVLGSYFDCLKSSLTNNSDISGSDFLSYLQLHNFDVFLLFDYRFMQFTIIFEIEFLLPTDGSLKEILSPEQDKLDFYNFVRNIFVKETDLSDENPFISELKNKLKRRSVDVINEMSSIKVNYSDLIIKNNTGNVTNIVTATGIEESEHNKLSRLLLELNDFAERIINGCEPIKLISPNITKEIKDSYFYFNGRFHTVFLDAEIDEYRYIPIQYQVQFLWFYLSNSISLLLEDYNESILNNNSSKNLEMSNMKIDFVINKVELLTIFNRQFKTAIETDVEIYNKVEHRWNIEDLLAGSSHYINFFKDYLERLYIRKTSKTEQKQNRILLFLTLFQFIALLSVWTDYLSLLSTDFTNKLDVLLPIFHSYFNIEKFNIYLPIFFVVSILGMIFYIYKSKE